MKPTPIMSNAINKLTDQTISIIFYTLFYRKNLFMPYIIF